MECLLVANPKLIITAGCSFSTVTRPEVAWPTHLCEIVKPAKEIHLGQGAIGNGIISRRVIYNVTKELETTRPEDILVCIMWSSFDRSEVYSNMTIPHTALNSGAAHHNPVKVAEANNFYVLNPNFEDETTTLYYKHFYNDVYATMLTLEHILRIQWFLQSYKIKHFMTMFSSQTLPLKDEPQERDIMNNPDISYLFNLVDKTNFLPVASLGGYIQSTGLYPDYGTPGTNLHPTTEQHKLFTDKIIIPYLKNKGYID